MLLITTSVLIKKFVDLCKYVFLLSKTTNGYLNSFFISLNQHVHKANLFSNARIKNYSEEDFKLKFWSYIFEEIFGYCNINLKW